MRAYLLENDIPRPTTQDNDLAPLPPADNEELATTPNNVNICIDLDDMRKNQMTDDEARELKYDLTQKLNELDRFIHMYRCGNMPYAALENIIVNALAGIGNTFGHILALLKTKILRGFSSFQRSELTAYVQSNKITIMRLYGVSHWELKDTFIVEIPKGMKGTYLNAINALSDYLNTLNMERLSKGMVDTLQSITYDMKKQNPEFSQHVTIANNLIDKSCNDKFQKLSTIFTEDNNSSCKFGQVFETDELKPVVEKCIDMDIHFRCAAAVNGRIGTIEKEVNSIIAEGSKINPDQADSLSKIIRVFAETFDTYGITLTDLSRVNHNLYFMLTQMRNFCKM